MPIWSGSGGASRDRPRRSQYPALVVLTRHRDAGAAEDLAGADVAVHAEQRDVLGQERCLDGPQRRVKPVGQLPRAVRLEDLVGTGEPHERNGGDAMHRVGRGPVEDGCEAAREQSRCQLVVVVAGGEVSGGGGRGRAPAQQQGAVVTTPGRAGRELLAVAPLTTISPARAAFSHATTSVVPGRAIPARDAVRLRGRDGTAPNDTDRDDNERRPTDVTCRMPGAAPVASRPQSSTLARRDPDRRTGTAARRRRT